MGEKYNKEVGTRLYSKRKELKLTRAELGKKIKLHESTIKRYEDGEIKTLDIEKIKEFAEALETTPAYLMGWKDTSVADENIPNYVGIRKVNCLEIQYSKQAVKFLKKQDKVTAKRIISAINELPSGDVKKLQGKTGYRLRVGDFRIIFDKDGNILYIVQIGNRGEIYKS